MLQKSSSQNVFNIAFFIFWPKWVNNFWKTFLKDLKIVFSSLGPSKKILNPSCLFVPLINIRNKIWKLGFTLRPPSLNKTKNIKDMISAGPKQDILPHATTTHPTTIKELQTTKITKLYLQALLSLVFNRRFTISELKRKFISSSLGK